MKRIPCSASIAASESRDPALAPRAGLCRRRCEQRGAEDDFLHQNPQLASPKNNRQDTPTLGICNNGWGLCLASITTGRADFLEILGFVYHAGLPPDRYDGHSRRAMIVLLTDFGLEGPYTGQIIAVLQRDAPGVPPISLFANAPAAQPKPAAYLFAAYAAWFAGRHGAVASSIPASAARGSR